MRQTIITIAGEDGGGGGGGWGEGGGAGVLIWHYCKGKNLLLYIIYHVMGSLHNYFFLRNDSKALSIDIHHCIF